MSTKLKVNSLTKLATFAAGAMFIGLGASPASAVPMDFTWNPSGVLGTLAGSFTANNINISDNASISIPNSATAPGSITESGIINIGYFQHLPSLSIIIPSGMGTINATTGFQLYFSFSAGAHLTSWNPFAIGNPVSGQFDSLTYGFFLDQGGKATFNNGVLNANGDTQTTLATGSLIAGPNSVSITSGVPAAFVTTAFTPNLGQAAFFVAPAATVTLDLFSSFTNIGTTTLSQSSCGVGCLNSVFHINGGGGNANFIPLPVPEPGSLLLLGTGLLGLAGLRRKRARA